MERDTKIIALTGKGGVGKTSVSAALVKLLTEEFPKKKILAIDARRRKLWSCCRNLGIRLQKRL